MIGFRKTCAMLLTPFPGTASVFRELFRQQKFPSATGRSVGSFCKDRSSPTHSKTSEELPLYALPCPAETHESLRTQTLALLRNTTDCAVLALQFSCRSSQIFFRDPIKNSCPCKTRYKICRAPDPWSPTVRFSSAHPPLEGLHRENFLSEVFHQLRRITYNLLSAPLLLKTFSREYQRPCERNTLRKSVRSRLFLKSLGQLLGCSRTPF